MADRADFILGVDLDGVVANHTRRFREIMAELRGVDPETMPMDRSWDFHEWGFGPDEYAHYHRIAVMEHDMFRTMPVIEGATDALWRLSDAGVWIRIITHRLYGHWGHEKAVADTAAWLDIHKIPYRDLCFLGAKPQVEADAYIDDAPHNIEQLRAAGNTVIAFEQPYNRGLVGEPRARSWRDVEEIVTGLVADRTGSYERQLPGIDAGADRLVRRRDT
jgi:5'(3')-deoxyribonucleotidase